MIAGGGLELVEVGGGAGVFDGAEAGAEAVEETEEGGFLGGVDVGEEDPGAAAAGEGVELGGAFVK